MSVRDNLKPTVSVGKGVFTWVAIVAYMGMLLAVSLTPSVAFSGDARDATARWAYNAAHIPAYALLALLWCLALRHRRSAYVGYLSVYLAALSVAVGFGVAVEIAQTYVPGRTASFLDGCLNGVGALVGVAVAAALVLKRGHLRTPGEHRLAEELREMLRKQVSRRAGGRRPKRLPPEEVPGHP